MRQLAVLPNADAAQALADYLQTQRIETRLEQLPEGCVVWVFDEDRLPQARKELADFTANPSDPRFAAARRTAEAERRKIQQTVEEAPPIIRPPPWTPRPIHCTSALIFLCCVVFAAHTGYLIQQNGGIGSTAAFTILLQGHAEGRVEFSSPVEQTLAIAPFVDLGQGRIGWNGLDAILHGQVWRLITPIFLHFGVIHLMFNMIMLRQMGAAMEMRSGVLRYLLLILVCAVGSNVAQYYLSWVGRNGVLFHANPLFGGMSGVLYGLFGYIWMKGRYEPELGLGLSPPIVLWMIVWLFLCMTGLMGSVANTAHVVGLLIGVALGVAPHLWRQVRGVRPR